MPESLSQPAPPQRIKPAAPASRRTDPPKARLSRTSGSTTRALHRSPRSPVARHGRPQRPRRTGARVGRPPASRRRLLFSGARHARALIGIPAASDRRFCVCSASDEWDPSVGLSSREEVFALSAEMRRLDAGPRICADDPLLRGKGEERRGQACFGERSVRSLSECVIDDRGVELEWVCG